VLQPIMNDPAQATAASARLEEMKRTATSANTAFASALLSDAEARARRLSAEASASPAGETARGALEDLRSSIQATSSSTDPSQSLNAARSALAKSRALAAALTAAHSAEAASKRATEIVPKAPKPAVATVTQIAPATSTNTVAPAPTSTVSTATVGVSPAKKAQLNSIISSGRGMAKQVIQTGSKENAQLARNYDKYLANVADSARGAKSDGEMDKLIKQASQTKAYIVFLTKQPSGK
jgi:non-specific serine/threonine protein kinase